MTAATTLVHSAKFWRSTVSGSKELVFFFFSFLFFRGGAVTALRCDVAVANAIDGLTGGGTYQPSQSDAIASLLKNLVHRAGVQEPVTLSIDNVEAPLLTSDKGDVVTLLNHHALVRPFLLLGSFPSLPFCRLLYESRCECINQ